MKNVKKMSQVLLFVLSFLFISKSGNAQIISPIFFGQNAWMPDSIGNAVYGGKLHQNWGKVQDSKAKLIRFGGISPDKNKPSNFQYIKMIDSIRAKGMEPVIQVPFHNWQYTAQQAADIVQYVNIVKGRNIKYWVIGNEPDLEYAYTNASQVAAYIKPFASAMKAVDPTILTIGPECAWFNHSIINGLTTPNGPDDITGKDAAGRYYVDIISFHTYPFDGSQSRAQVISKLTSANGFGDNLANLNTRITACNTAHGRTGTSALKTAVTEANVNYKNAASDNLYGVGVNSFIGGQFIAEMFGVGLKNNVSFMNIWSVIEGNNQELNIGYIDRVTGNKKPAYYHFKMMAEHFSGYYANGTTNNANVKAIGSVNGATTTVMVMNQDLSNGYNFTVRLNSSAVSGSNPLKININANVNAEYSAAIPAQSTMLYVFVNGALSKKVEYTLNNHAASNLPPTVTNLGVATAVNENENDLGDIKGFKINVYPNPCNSKFTIEMDKKNSQGKKLVVELFDIMGRLVYTKTSVFEERVQEIDLQGNSIAEAVYIVRVHEKEDKDNTQSEKIIIFK
ncbi:MAG: hypothetical protein K0S32_457 [Bacteroidetes bacterium]|nr:hypothetical protein [Bacteroidota bacterium]